MFAVITAGLFPLIHVGRVYLAAYWMAPLPNTNNLWVNFRSPLIWDIRDFDLLNRVAFVLYMGLVLDLASMRDRAKGIKRLVYGVLSFGWTGTLRQWHHYEAGYGFLAAGQHLVLSVH